MKDGRKHAWPQPRSAAADGIQATQRRIRAKAHTPQTLAMAKGAYIAHRPHFRSVPGSDVLVERLRPAKGLRAEPRAQRARATSAPSLDGQSSAWYTLRPVGRVRAERGASARDSGQLRRLDVGKFGEASVLSLVHIYHSRNERSMHACMHDACMHAWPQPLSVAADGIQATQRRAPSQAAHAAHAGDGKWRIRSSSSPSKQCSRLRCSG